MDRSVLNIDAPAAVQSIRDVLLDSLSKQLRKRGLVIAISGGVDSAVCASLCVEAVGAKKVFGLLLPETDSASESLTLGKEVAEYLNIDYEVHNISSTLEGIGCYQWRDEAIRRVFPDYTEVWKSKIAISGGLEGQFNHFKLIVQSPDGELMEGKLRLKDYLQIVAATNYKQRIRKTIEYFHADRLNYAVIGTPNRLEYDQGFFVKNGDGSADIKPIAHLYKTQVYTLAHYFGLPEEVCSAVPTTDTYSLSQGQDEFYFSLPYDKMDLALWGLNHSISPAGLASCLDMDEAMAEAVYADIRAKRRATTYLHRRPLLMEAVEF